MLAALRYLQQVEQLIKKLQSESLQSLEAGADLMATSLMNEGMIHVFGTGHSHMLAEEMFYRAGGLAAVQPILVEDLMLHGAAVRSTAMERLEGYADIILDHYDVKAGDVMIIASNSGRNAVTIEMAIAAKRKHLNVIAITNKKHAMASTSRHKTGKKLYDLADIVIDNHGCVGDAAIEIEGLSGQKVSPTSTAIGAAIIQALVAETVERMVIAGRKPEIFCSSNVDGGEQVNERIISKYKGVVRSL